MSTFGVKLPPCVRRRTGPGPQSPGSPKSHCTVRGSASRAVSIVYDNYECGGEPFVPLIPRAVGPANCGQRQRVSKSSEIIRAACYCRLKQRHWGLALANPREPSRKLDDCGTKRQSRGAELSIILAFGCGCGGKGRRGTSQRLAVAVTSIVIRATRIPFMAIGAPSSGLIA